MHTVRVLLTLLSFVICAIAQDPPANPTPGKEITVIIKPVMPFAFEEGGQWKGYSIDLWKRLAQEVGITFKFTTAKTAKEAIEAVQKKEADAAIGALSVTSEREKLIDFTHSFYDSGLQILVGGKTDSSAFTAFSGLFKADTLKVIGVLVLALLLNSHILWWLERRGNAESFPESYKTGLVESVWWSVCTLITGGCENKAPLGIFGRLAAIVWMLAGIGLTAYITATLSAALTVSNLTSEISGVGDLQHHTVATVTDSAAARYLEARKINVKGFASVEDACRAVAKGEVKAVVYDAPLLRYYVATNPSATLQFAGEIFEKQKYAFALQDKSPLRKDLNRELLELAEQNYFEELDKKWFASVAK